MSTAGRPYALRLVADRSEIKADGQDLTFITVQVVDKEGNLCPDADQSISIKVKGDGKFRAMANGDPSSLEMFHNPKMHAFHGQLTAIAQSSDNPGVIDIIATAPGLKKASIQIVTK